MSVPPLPVPELEQTLDRLLSAARPLLSAEQLDQTRQDAADFQNGEGPALQQRLQDFAGREQQQGRSWLSQQWLDGYLTTRDPLPLSTSVGFQIADEPGTPGLDRAARFIHRAAAIHLQELRGETPVEVSPRGAEMSMEQWQTLRGGLRHPRPGRDEIRRPEVRAADAEIGILHRGRLRALPIADDDGQPRSIAWIAQALRGIVAAPASWTEAGTETGQTTGSEDQLPFGAVSWLPADEAADVLDEMLETPANASTYDRLTRLVFTVTLQEQAAEQQEHVRRLAFGFHDAWVRKPLSYEIGLQDTWTGVHVEHSTIDGATVLAAVHRMQQLEIDETQPPHTDQTVETEQLSWDLSLQLQQRIADGLQEVRQAAEPHTVRLVTVPRLADDARPFRLSDDALQQLIFTVAQQDCFGRVRAVYESVDVREYQAGRTECLRPVTPQAVEFATSALAGEATVEQLRAANDAHKDWVKACKAGHGPDRHLAGLRQMAGQADGPDDDGAQLFRSEALSAVAEDFLSTTSVGGAESIVRYAFAPSRPEGFGIAYTKGDGAFEFCLSFRRDTAQDADGFAEALRRAAEVIAAVVAPDAR